MASLGDLIIRVGGNIDGFRIAMQDAVDQIDYFADEIEKRFKSIEDVGKRLATVGAEITAGVTVPLVALGTAAIETAAQFEQTQIAFNTLAGSADAATTQLTALYKFASETPFQLEGILQGSRTLMAMQFSAQDIIPVLRILGDTASGLGLGQEGMERLVFHFGQIKALGAIDGRIIREMGMAGINAGQMLADALGKTVPEVMDMVHKKAIGATTAINALLEGMQNKFGGLMEDQMKSLAGAFTNLKDNVTLSLVAIGNTMLPVGKTIVSVLSDLTEKVKEFAKWFGELPAPVQDAALALLAMAAALGPVMVLIGGLMMTLPGVIALAGALGVTLGELAVEVVVATAGLALLVPALIGLGVWISEHLEGVKAFFAEVTNEVPEIALLAAGFDTLTEALKAFGSWIAGRSAEVREFLQLMILATPGLELAAAAMKAAAGSASGPVAAFEAADAAAQKAKASTDAVTKALHDLRLTGTEAFAGLSDPKEAWAARQAEQIKIATAAVATLEEAEKKGTVTADQLAKAHQRLNALRAEKMPDFTERGAKESTKLSDPERAKAKEIDGELAHSKAIFAIEADRIKFKHEMHQISDAEELAQLNSLSARELAAERTALEAKKVIYKANLTERQAIDNQLAALADRAALVMQQAGEKVDVAAAKKGAKDRAEQDKLDAFMSKMAVEGDALSEKMGTGIVEAGAKAATIGSKGAADQAEAQVQAKKLAAERAYGQELAHTGADQIAQMRLIASFDAQSMTIREAKLRVAVDQAQTDFNQTHNYSDQARLLEAQDALNKAIGDDSNKRYATDTAIGQKIQEQNAGLQAQKEVNQAIADWSQNLLGKIQKDIADALVQIPQALGTSLASALTGGGKKGEDVGQQITKALAGIGKQLLGEVFTQAIEKLVASIALQTGLQALWNSLFPAVVTPQVAATIASTAAVLANTAAQATSGGLGAAGGIAGGLGSAAGAAGSAASSAATGMIGPLISAAGGIIGGVISAVTTWIGDNKIVKAVNGTTAAVQALGSRLGSATTNYANGLTTNAPTTAANSNTGLSSILQSLLSVASPIPIPGGGGLFSSLLGGAGGGGFLSSILGGGSKPVPVTVSGSSGALAPGTNAATTTGTGSTTGIPIIGGLLQSLLGFGGGSSQQPVPVSIVDISPLSPISGFFKMFGFAEGGIPPINVPSVCGERGPELFIPHGLGTIIPNHQLRAFAASAGAFGSSVSSSSQSSSMSFGDVHLHGVQNPRDLMRGIANIAKNASPKFSPFAS